MPSIKFEDILKSLSRLPDVIKSIPDIVRQPAANPLQAAILLSMFLVVLIIILLTVVLLIMRPSYEGDEAEGEGHEEAGRAGGAADVSAEPQRAMSWLTVGSIVVLTLTLVWIAAGVTTGSREVCASCHADSAHAAASADDPHKYVACVACHETGGGVARVTVNVVTRIQHVVFARLRPDAAVGYGIPAASDGCARCHSGQISSIRVNPRGVKVSHKEPLAAGAQCVDCHILKSGIIGPTTSGMTPCLRCHDGTTARAECITCHIGDPANAIRATVATESLAAALVPNPQCGGCHFNMTRCNACHGLSLPHTVVFEAYGHARAGALDIWNNTGVCKKCHYPGHRDCQTPLCHQAAFPQHPSPDWRITHQGSSWSGSASGCSCHKWNPVDHAGMNYCQICHAVKPPNAVP